MVTKVTQVTRVTELTDVTAVTIARNVTAVALWITKSTYL